MTRRKSADENRIKKIKRRSLLCRKIAKDGSIAFRYEMSFDGGGYVIGITMTGKNFSSNTERRFPFESEKAAMDFFCFCAECKVTPLNLVYVYEDYML